MSKVRLLMVFLLVTGLFLIGVVVSVFPTAENNDVVGDVQITRQADGWIYGEYQTTGRQAVTVEAIDANGNTTSPNVFVKDTLLSHQRQMLISISALNDVNAVGIKVTAGGKVHIYYLADMKIQPTVTTGGKK